MLLHQKNDIIIIVGPVAAANKMQQEIVPLPSKFGRFSQFLPTFYQKYNKKLHETPNPSTSA